MCRNKQEAEEIAQAAWVHAYERLSQLQSESSISAWVIAIAINIARSEMRKNKRSLPNIKTSYNIAQRIDCKILAEKVFASSKIRAEERHVLYLAYILGMNTAEIETEIPNLAKSSIRVLLLRGRKNARRILSQ
jgi:RNA polymerase sigma-70 factor (ECF subfamily)